MAQRFDLVVASHLRWSFVWQRPQQLMSRIARERRILFVEEPVFSDSISRETRPALQTVAQNITVLAPRVPMPDREGTPVWSDCERIGAQVRYAMHMLRFRSRALWFYTPLPEFLLHAVEPDIVVYDVMDELANFKFAPPQLKEQEVRLLRRADVVFTGGASLYEAKRPFNINTHLFASGVDEKHYAKACDEETRVPDYVQRIAAPRATYIGVIDERLDYNLLAAVAARRPDVQFLLVGPVVKVDPDDLPKAANLHYLGQQDYADLPCILKGTDICLMPFARNDATRYISPTKTLEYMASHRPIVTTPIRDVERFYSDVVYLAEDTEQFAKQLDVALNEAVARRTMRLEREAHILAEYAWDTIAANMDRLMEDAFARRAQTKASVSEPSPYEARRVRATSSTRSPSASVPMSGQ